MTERFQIHSGAEAALARLGLDTFDSLLTSRAGLCMLRDETRQAYRIPMGDSTEVNLRRDVRLPRAEAIAQLLRGRAPLPSSVLEFRSIRRLAELGIATPKVLAWGHRRHGLLGGQGVLVTLCPAGERLDEWLERRGGKPGSAEVMRGVAHALRTLYEADLHWPDADPRRVIVGADGQIALVETESVWPIERAVKWAMPAEIHGFCRGLRRTGAPRRDLEALLEVIGDADLVRPERILDQWSELSAWPRAVLPAGGLACPAGVVELDEGRVIAHPAWVDQLSAEGMDKLDTLSEASGDSLELRGWELWRFDTPALAMAAWQNLIRLGELGLPAHGFLAGTFEPGESVVLVEAVPEESLAGETADRGRLTRKNVKVCAGLLAVLHAEGLCCPTVAAADLRLSDDGADGATVAYLATSRNVADAPRKPAKRFAQHAADVRGVVASLAAIVDPRDARQFLDAYLHAAGHRDAARWETALKLGGD